MGTVVIPSVKTKEPACVKRLQDRVDKFNGDSNITPQESRRLLVDFVDCFIQFECWTRERMDQLEGLMTNKTKEKGAKETPPSVQPVDSDWFKSTILWLRDKVLPKIVELAILWLFAWLITQIKGG